LGLGIKKKAEILMNSWISKIKDYLNKFLEVGVLLLAVSVIAEILFGPDVPFFGSKVTNNLIDLLNKLGEQGIAALIVVFAVIFVFRKLLK
jgi:hypothetical protein